MSFKAPEMPKLPDQPLPPPMFGERQPLTKKKSATGQPQTFLGTGSIPNVTQLGNKTLIGQ